MPRTPLRRRPASGVVRSLVNQWPRVPLTVGELARLTATRDRHGITCFQVDGRARYKLAKRLGADPAGGSSPSCAPPCAAPAGPHERKRANALRRRVKVSLRNLKKTQAPVRDRQGPRRRELPALVHVYQGRLDAGS